MSFSAHRLVNRSPHKLGSLLCPPHQYRRHEDSSLAGRDQEGHQPVPLVNFKLSSSGAIPVMQSEAGTRARWIPPEPSDKKQLHWADCQPAVTGTIICTGAALRSLRGFDDAHSMLLRPVRGQVLKLLEDGPCGTCGNHLRNGSSLSTRHRRGSGPKQSEQQNGTKCLSDHPDVPSGPLSLAAAGLRRMVHERHAKNAK